MEILNTLNGLSNLSDVKLVLGSLVEGRLVPALGQRTIFRKCFPYVHCLHLESNLLKDTAPGNNIKITGYKIANVKCKQIIQTWLIILNSRTSIMYFKFCRLHW